MVSLTKVIVQKERVQGKKSRNFCEKKKGAERTPQHARGFDEGKGLLRGLNNHTREGRLGGGNGKEVTKE